MKLDRLVILAAVIFCATASLFAQSPCDKLQSLSFPDASITAIEYVPPGPYMPPISIRPQASPAEIVPAHCRLFVELTPSKDSHIESEVWLPVENWNGKLQVVGNGGWAGVISYFAMPDSLKEGYATASMDTGHKLTDGSGNGRFALGHPEKLIDFGYRGLHEITIKAKAIVAEFYDKGPRYSYYNGCSTGGRQGLMEVTRYPEDFDGVVVGAPANPHIHLHAADIERNMILRKDPGHSMSAAKLAILHKAVMDSCDTLDGIKDGLLENPEMCRFDPATLLCKGTDTDLCLTAPQVEAAKLIYSDIKTKKLDLVWTGFPRGGELEYRSLTAIIIPNAPPPSFPLDSFRILAYQDPNWDWRTWDLDREVALADQKAGYIDVHTYDLSAFKARGGKLLLYHGWSDPGIAAGNTVNFYKGVLAKMGEKQDDWFRLFMVPGMLHCSGGPGPDQFNKMAVMERWRESGIVPDQIIATHVTGSTVDMTRPLCPYPKVAVYKGSGSTNDAVNFTCK
jgi:feruloyl esterase